MFYSTNIGQVIVKLLHNVNQTWIIHGVAVKVAESHIVTVF